MAELKLPDSSLHLLPLNCSLFDFVFSFYGTCSCFSKNNCSISAFLDTGCFLFCFVLT